MQEEYSYILQIFSSWWPALLVVIISTGILLTLRYFLFVRKSSVETERQLSRQLLMFILTSIAVVLIILALPIGDSARGQLLSLLGILATAAIALSSTTFVGNAMAGFMLRAVENFRPGDFVRVGDHFGRVSERGLLHTEIQTEDRDLTTLPNLYLVTNPVTVVRSSGTIISATVSLGYDIPHSRIIELLIRSGEQAELKESFVQILELGDFSITYRVAGFLSEVKTLISTRSRLRSCILSVLHENGVEIVSPTFMNQRRIEGNQKFMPKVDLYKEKEEVQLAPEEIIFDKADQAEFKKELLEKLEKLETEKKSTEEQIKKTKFDSQKEILLKKLNDLNKREKQLEDQVAAIVNQNSTDQ